ncbi:MAG: hypothetical protein CMC98_02620, partial [Flavobacteriales bacterium]|nr:hypothetical protein [Flavobacteriales bacterium]
MENIAILTGGDSAEYDISILSALNVQKNIDKSKFRCVIVHLKNGIYKTDDAIIDLKDFSYYSSNIKYKIDKAFIRTGLAHKTKNRGSNRTLDFTASQAKHLQWFFDYMFNARPHNKFLFAGSRGDGPIGSYTFRRIVWKTYEAVGLAKMKWFMK